jgi:hypothetical protein
MDTNQQTNAGLSHSVLGLSQPSSPAPGQVSSPLAGAAPEPIVPTQDHSAALTPEDDTAALDQEWVAKAKNIVEQTKGDPFTQSRELNKIKAGYLKVRFNKELKIGEDST